MNKHKPSSILPRVSSGHWKPLLYGLLALAGGAPGQDVVALRHTARVEAGRDRVAILGGRTYLGGQVQSLKPGSASRPFFGVRLSCTPWKSGTLPRRTISLAVIHCPGSTW